MARISVLLTDSFLEALNAMPDWAQDEVAEVIRALEDTGDFDPDPAEYIIERGSPYVRECESVREWIHKRTAPTEKIRLSLTY